MKEAIDCSAPPIPEVRRDHSLIFVRLTNGATIRAERWYAIANGLEIVSAPAPAPMAAPVAPAPEPAPIEAAPAHAAIVDAPRRRGRPRKTEV